MLTLTVLYTYFCTIIFCIVFQIGFLVKAQQNLSIKHFLWVYVFLFYLALVYMVTGIGNIWVIGRYETLIRISEINLLPFASEGSTTYILNIILFMPLGFLLPTIWPQFRSIKNVAYTGLSFSLAIELSQLLNHRITDIDDLLMNTLGAIIGYLIYSALFVMVHKRGEIKPDIKSSLVVKYEAVFYLVCSFIGMILLHYPILFRKLI
ncbi:VanZ family protein [Brevibacillus laterosporus]|uniref:VanZ family protein n=1 Tax=Brevibacillus halotolerans TaxID=1507437 RepID=A0ABT4HWM9_9BACL|nr:MULTISPECIES: VanZ family protein [Brevibacillus]MCR8985471.1 VanZ family protein [Brevibacillus laterosporus]MCZ0831204.1 VanZ family protein [Brevibacillus halotolerans]